MSTRALRKFKNQELADNATETGSCSDSSSEVENVRVNRFAFLVFLNFKLNLEILGIICEFQESDDVKDSNQVDVECLETKIKQKPKKKRKAKPHNKDRPTTDGDCTLVEDITYNESLKAPSATSSEPVYDESSLLRIEYKNLRADTELSRMFGLAVHALRSSDGSSAGRSATRQNKSRNRSAAKFGGKIIQLKPAAAAAMSKTGENYEM